MVEIWYVILTFMLLMFVVLEGFDIGAGMLQYVVGKDEAERRLVIAAIGPLWSWHEVWLVGFGGSLLLSFPAIMAASFSGFYLALMLLLWCLVLRGISIEMSGHIDDPLWRTGWHVCFVASNILLAILIGAALGNVVRGVPVRADGKFALPFFTNFSPTGDVGILDWYTLSLALFIFAAFAAHGASGLAVRTEGAVRDRSLRVAGVSWIAVAALLVLVVIESQIVRPDFWFQTVHQPFGCIGLVLALAGLICAYRGLRLKKEVRALAGSSLFLAGLMIAGAAGVFPLILRSTIAPEFSLSAYRTAAEGRGLAVALVWWPLALVFAVGYFFFTFKFYSGKVQPGLDTQTPY